MPLIELNLSGHLAKQFPPYNENGLIHVIQVDTIFDVVVVFLHHTKRKKENKERKKGIKGNIPEEQIKQF